ncbi:MAG: ATP-dependent metallopeptidase FtsH/Yme1/Tma family protein, partial [Thermoplasmata archaeon]
MSQAPPPGWGQQPGSGPPSRRQPGSGGPGQQRRPPLWKSWRWWVFIGVILAANILIANLAPQGTSRVTIPYSTFKAQVEAGNVASVNATGETIQGHAKKAVSAPGSTQSSQDFQTQRPAFASGPNGDALEA